MPDKVTITDTGVKLAVLEGVRAEDQRTLARLIERLREKQSELTRVQREAKDLAQKILVTQRQVAAISDEMARLVDWGSVNAAG